MINLENLRNLIREEKEKGDSLIAHFFLAEHGTTVAPQPLLYSSEIFPKIKKLMEQARHSIYFQFYRGNDDDSDFKNFILPALIELNKKAGEGGYRITIKWLENFKTGTLIRFFHHTDPQSFTSFVKRIQNGEFPNLDFEIILHTHSAFGAYHAKQVIIDPGKNGHAILMTSDTKRSKVPETAEGGEQLETGILLQGPITQQMEKDFLDAAQPRRQCSRITPPILGDGEDVDDTEDIVLSDVNRQTTSPPRWEETPILFLAKHADGSPCAGMNTYSPYKIAILAAIKAETKAIRVIMPNFNDSDIIAALADACYRNVEVIVYLPKYRNEYTERFIGGTNSENFNKLLRLISEESRKNLTWYWTKDQSGRPSLDSKIFSYANHGRYVSFESSNLIFMGSSIFDKQSLNHSRETDVVLQSQTLREKYDRAIFEECIGKNKFSYDDELENLRSDILFQISNLLLKRFTPGFKEYVGKPEPEKIIIQKKEAVLELMLFISKADSTDQIQQEINQYLTKPTALSIERKTGNMVNPTTRIHSIATLEKIYQQFFPSPSPSSTLHSSIK